MAELASPNSKIYFQNSGPKKYFNFKIKIEILEVDG